MFSVESVESVVCQRKSDWTKVKLIAIMHLIVIIACTLAKQPPCSGCRKRCAGSTNSSEVCSFSSLPVGLGALGREVGAQDLGRG